ncbi:enoyl-CoA hydratase/carnithine racemase [Paraburkholderia sp. WC7.3d]
MCDAHRTVRCVVLTAQDVSFCAGGNVRSMRSHRDKAAARRYFEEAIVQNGEPETATIDKSGSNPAALQAFNAER